MGEEDMLLIYQLVNAMPGKTMSQKLNFFQDLGGSLGFDPFGGDQRDFVEEPYYDAPNRVDQVWGRDPVASVLFDAIDEGMSPMEAYQAAVERELVKEPAPGEKAQVDYLDLASQYATAEAARLADKAQFETEQAGKRAVFESKRQPSLMDLFNAPTLYEAAGAPTEQELAEEYVQGDPRFRSQSNLAKRGAAQNVVGAGRQAVAGLFGKRMDERPMMKTSFSDDPVLNQYVQRIATEKANKELPIMKSRMMPTDRGQQALQMLSMLKMFGS